MSAIAFNNAATVLVSAVTTTDTIINVVDVSEFALSIDLPNWEGALTDAGDSWSYITMENIDRSQIEVVRLRNVTADVVTGAGTLTIERIADTVNRFPFSVGDYVELRITSQLMTDMSSNGKTIRNGLVDPTVITGAQTGDFYLRTDTSTMFGPVVVSGSVQTWGTGVSLVGATGATGPTGLTGDTGTSITGETGLQGIQGETGPQGEIGLTGADSTVVGPQGEQGIQGIQGIQGEIGLTGADSVVVGPQGGQGIQGIQGETGLTGADSVVAGPQGSQGNQGNQGIQGIQGETGPQGPAGADGADGSDPLVDVNPDPAYAVANASATGIDSIAIGSGVTASGDYGAISIGYYSSATGDSAVNLGAGTADGASSVSLGSSANANHTFSVALGSGSFTTADRQLVLGGDENSNVGGTYDSATGTVIGGTDNGFTSIKVGLSTYTPTIDMDVTTKKYVDDTVAASTYTVTSLDVTTHEEDINITESQIVDLGAYLTSVPAQAFSSLTGTPTTVSGYGITDAFDGAYSSLTGTPTGNASTAYVDAAISALAASAPETLNTLNELAEALGDDPNFSTTVTNSVATKLPLAGGTMTGAIDAGTNNVSNVGTLTATTVEATTLDLGDWTVTETSTDLVFAFNGANTMKIDSSGNLKVTGNVSGFEVL